MLLTTFLSRPNPRASFPIIHLVRAYSVPADPPVPKKKVWDSVDSAVKAVKSGDVLLSGGTICR
jgi:3-oxoacid CoA-transferase